MRMDVWAALVGMHAAMNMEVDPPEDAIAIAIVGSDGGMLVSANRSTDQLIMDAALFSARIALRKCVRVYEPAFGVVALDFEDNRPAGAVGVAGCVRQENAERIAERAIRDSAKKIQK